MTESIVVVKKERSILRTSIDKYIDRIKTLIENEDADISELELVIEQLNETSLELKNTDIQLKQLIKDSQIDTELQTAEEYREKITIWRFKAKKKIENQEKPVKFRTQSEIEQQQNRNKEIAPIHLPKLFIQKFTGYANDWLSFWSIFESTIHKNENLDPVEKFSYLKSYLTGSALKCVEGFAITSDNYTKCVELLTERYGKKEVLIETHLNNIIDLQPVKYSTDLQSLRNLYDKIQINVRSLESLKVNISSYENLLSPIILKLIPKEILLEFHKSHINKSYSSKDILEYLFIHISAREKINCSNDQTGANGRPDSKIHRPKRGSPPTFTNHFPAANELFVNSKINKTKRNICSFCESVSHDSNSCFRVMNLPFNEKLKILRKKGICFKCLLIANHVGKDCFSKVTCTRCKGAHSDIMCNRNISSERNTDNETKKVEDSIESNQTLSNYDNKKRTYLQTLIAHVKGNKSSALVRCLIDSGSENTYLSKYVANKLNFNKIREEKVKHGLFGGIEFLENHSKYQFTLSSLDKNFSCRIQALDQDRICTGVNCVSDKKLISSLENNNVYLTDVFENRELCLYEKSPEEIHLLLGADFAGQIFTENVKYLPDLGLAAFGTKLGWVVMGKSRGDKRNFRNDDSLSNLSLSLHVSNANLENLWKLDALGISNDEHKTKADLQEEVQNYFLETVNQDSSGRYEISLPWVVDPSLLPSNRSIAESALFKTNKKLIASKKKDEYSDIFNFWELEKIIEEVPDDKTDRVHFLPHRPVIKESSETTKMRPVFNASAHIKDSPSLNDCLTKGPNLIETIPRILNRFRKYCIGISSDIEKAFLQIKITEKDRDFLRFFWRDDEDNLKIYRHCRVVFGLTSSPFLLVATLKHLLSHASPPLTETAKVLENSFYIDNSLTSLDSEQQTKQFIKESVSLLASAKFNLRCWRSNWPTAMIDEEENKPKFAPVLGLIWDLESDNLMCKVDEKIRLEKPYSKRKILSIIQKFFDPIGFTSPVVLIPKLILQQTWILKLKWDEELPEDLSKQFNNWIRSIDLLSKIKVPRWLNLDSENENRATLHIFSDASKVAYATCAFIRIETPEGVKIQLVNARSRVSPLKELTIPRLELLSCLIGARLAKTVSVDLGLEKIRKIYWSDSTTALGWIRREQSWGTYVHNRVQEIRQLSTISDWRHVPGSMNPADLLSRGCSFEHLRGSKWWEGPSWLYSPEDKWPQGEEPPDEQTINKEKRKSILTLVDTRSNNNWYYKYFSYNKIIKMISWINRFIYNLRNIDKNLSSNISVEEFERAEKIVIKLIQNESFSGITDPKLKSLAPLEDEKGILRVKTCIINRNDTENFRYPILLPSAHPVVERLILETHARNHHAGVGTLLSLLRENFWILKSRKTIRNIIRKCIKCQRYQSRKIDAEPGVPPEDRVRDAAVFEVVGTDLAGPLYLSDGTKSWIVLFTCAIYRALHLELISSLSTETFLESFRRFIARRGRPYIVYSDNGTNYLGTANALATLDWHRISAETSTQKIRWKFNPPASPWWGGWWERLVRMIKELLRKSLGRASLTYEELNTILCDIERVVNSRPITYLSEDNREMSPLTPLMFLQELSSSGVPDFDELDNSALNRRVRYRQKLREILRNRFRKEYLGQLRLHSLKKENLRNLCVGDIVLLEDSSGKRIHWPLAKIIQLYPGKDGIVRLAKVQTQTGSFLRPVQRLHLLEVCNKDSVSSEVCNKDSVSSEVCNKDSVSSEVCNKDSVSSEVCNKASVSSIKPAACAVTKSGRAVRPPQRLQID